MLAGGVLLVVGVLVRLGLLSWFGNLPGDVRLESGSSRVHIPVTSAIVVSVVITVLVNVVATLLRDR